MSEPGSGSVDVLVVDDDAAVARLVRAVLEREGWSVRHVADADEALAFLAGTSCRLVLTDFTMPEKDGLELVREVEAAGHRAVFLVMSAYLEPAVMGRLCQEPAVAGVLGKPFELSALVGDVRTLLLGAGPAGAPAGGASC